MSTVVGLWGVVVLLAGIGCGSGVPPEARVSVELVRGEPGDAGEVIGDTLAAVTVGDERRTLVAWRLPEAALARLQQPEPGEEPPRAGLELPVPPPEWARGGLDIVMFEDADADGELDAGEPWTSAWDGGRGSFRLAWRSETGRWVLVEGGLPATEHGLEEATVRLDPRVPVAVRDRGPDSP